MVATMPVCVNHNGNRCTSDNSEYSSAYARCEVKPSWISEIKHHSQMHPKCWYVRDLSQTEADCSQVKHHLQTCPGYCHVTDHSHMEADSCAVKSIIMRGARWSHRGSLKSSIIRKCIPSVGMSEIFHKQRQTVLKSNIMSKRVQTIVTSQIIHTWKLIAVLSSQSSFANMTRLLACRRSLTNGSSTLLTSPKHGGSVR